VAAGWFHPGRADLACGTSVEKDPETRARARTSPGGGGVGVFWKFGRDSTQAGRRCDDRESRGRPLGEGKGREGEIRLVMRVHRRLNPPGPPQDQVV